MSFDYENFAQDLRVQASGFISDDFKEGEKWYILNSVYNNAYLFGESLISEDRYTDEQKMTVCRTIAEWVFLKSTDMIKSGIDEKYWDQIMKQIAQTIFVYARRCIYENIDDVEMHKNIKMQVETVYQDCTKNLV